jgi:hypothetical protein
MLMAPQTLYRMDVWAGKSPTGTQRLLLPLVLKFSKERIDAATVDGCGRSPSPYSVKMPSPNG